MPAKPSKYIEKAQDCMEQFPPQVELAAKFFKKAFEMAPTDCDVLDAFGEFLANCGENEIAMQVLMQSCALEPEKNSSKYMYLSQLKQGKDSLECIERGIILMRKEMANKERDEKLCKMQIASAYCSVAEIYMTDLCDEPEAEDKCKQALKEAVELDPDDFEVNAQCAQFCKTVIEDAKAKVHCQKCMEVLEKVKTKPEEWPPGPVRATFTQTLLDLGLSDAAGCVIETLMEEDDEDPQLWYLAASANAQQGDKPGAMECLQTLEGLVGKRKEEFQPLLHCVQRLKKNIAKIPDFDDDAAEVGVPTA